MLLSCAPVHNVHRVVVRLDMFVSLVLLVRVIVQRVDGVKFTGCRLLFFVAAAKYEPFSFDGCFALREPDMVELCRMA